MDFVVVVSFLFFMSIFAGVGLASIRVKKDTTHDYLVAGGMSGLPIWRFPFTLTLARIFFHWKVQAKLAQLPWYGQLYMPDHESSALPISVEVVHRFVAVAQARGKRSVVQLLPSILDFQHYARTGVWPYQSLIDALVARNVLMHNLGDDMLCLLYTSPSPRD